jgi:dTDP-4-dehydrorhamnose reductase
VAAIGRPALDLLDEASVVRMVDAVVPDVVVNAAAYTAVDKAEREVDAAFAINRDGAGIVARAAEARGCPIIHLSTDHVFDGLKPAPYVETDLPNPVGAYGRSKFVGETAVVAANPCHVILRTAWLYGGHGQPFLKTLARLTRDHPELRIVGDQQGNPTYAPHLAQTILEIAIQLTEDSRQDLWGVFHAAGSGSTTWHGFADAIASTATRLGAPQAPLVPIATDVSSTPVQRPLNSRLDCGKLARVYSLRLPMWQQGLEECIGRLAEGPKPTGRRRAALAEPSQR